MLRSTRSPSDTFKLKRLQLVITHGHFLFHSVLVQRCVTEPSSADRRPTKPVGRLSAAVVRISVSLQL